MPQFIFDLALMPQNIKNSYFHVSNQFIRMLHYRHVSFRDMSIMFFDVNSK